MDTSKDNPYKPGTDEWRAFERDILNRQRFSIGKEYQDAKDIADKRIKTATDQIKAQKEKGVWVDEILKFLDGDTPEHDEVLDGPVGEKPDDKGFWKSLNFGKDPLNWNQFLSSYYKPVFKGNHVLPKNLPSNITDEQLYSTIIDVSNREYPEETYRIGYVAVPIKQPISFYIQSILDPTDLNYSVAEFYIRRK